jgi:hypothetical protein
LNPSLCRVEYDEDELQRCPLHSRALQGRAEALDEGGHVRAEEGVADAVEGPTTPATTHKRGLRVEAPLIQNRVDGRLQEVTEDHRSGIRHRTNDRRSRHLSEHCRVRGRGPSLPVRMRSEQRRCNWSRGGVRGVWGCGPSGVWTVGPCG